MDKFWKIIIIIIMLMTLKTAFDLKEYTEAVFRLSEQVFKLTEMVEKCINSGIGIYRKG